MPFGRLKWVSKKDRQPTQLFSEAWGVEGPEGGSKELQAAFAVGVTEWHRRHGDSERNKTSFFLVQIIAPVAAATATVLAVSGISKWAVIPSAIATVASSLLASFGLRENWTRLRLMTRELGFEIVQFAKGWGDYRGKSDDVRVDMLMKKIENLSVQSVFVPSKN